MERKHFLMKIIKGGHFSTLLCARVCLFSRKISMVGLKKVHFLTTKMVVSKNTKYHGPKTLCTAMHLATVPNKMFGLKKSSRDPGASQNT